MFSNLQTPDSTATIQEYADRTVELGQKVLSTCEHGWQGPVWEYYKAARDNNLKLLISAEPYWVKDRFEKDGTNCHIWIGAKNENGRQALNDILSEANITGFYRRPRIDVPLILSLPKDDVWCTTACVAYWQYDDIEDITALFAEHFGRNFYLEVQNHNTPKQIELNKRILKLREKLKVPIIAGLDSHYIHPKDSQKRTDFLVSKGIEYPDEDSWYMDFCSEQKTYERFAQQCVLSDSQIREAICNTIIFESVEEYDSPIFNSEIKMPTLYPDKTQEERDSIYKNLIWFKWKQERTSIPKEKWPLYESEIKKEVDTVVQTHMADYFIDNYYIIKKGKENGGRLTKSGRGSGVSFYTNKLLGFTEVDRIAAKVKMYPERFMSATRILSSGSLPDIDFNCADVAPFVQAQKDVLGDDHSYPMVAYGTAQKSAAWKLYAKAQEIPFEIANEISDQLKKYEMAVKHAKENDEDPEEVNVLDYIGAEFQDTYLNSKGYWGLITSWSIAPCSHLLYQGSIRKEIGLVKVKDNICCLMDGHWAEECHFLKNDMLKVSVWDLIYRTFDKLNEAPPTVSGLLEMCPPEDNAWKLYEKGCTLSVNQVEQKGTSARVTQYKPKNISELCAFVAAIRPGFKSMYKTFESRQPFSYGVKDFDSIIQTEEMPNSFILYQEMEMAVLNYAGIDMSECYTAIKNIAKKRADKVLAYKEKFLESMAKTMVEKDKMSDSRANELAESLWQVIEDSSRYSFNASHSYCVALDSLYCAWLKMHHPLEFYTTAITIQAEKGNKDKMNELKEEAENYFNIRFPLFKYGQDNRDITFDKEKNCIYNSLDSIKGFGKAVGEALFESAKDWNKEESFFDLLKRLDSLGIKSSKVIPLVKIGYFDHYGGIAELMDAVRAWDALKQGTAKQITKDAKEDPNIRDVITSSHNVTNINAKGKELKTYTIVDMSALLLEIWEWIESFERNPLPYKTLAANQKEILGYVDLTTGKEEDRRNLFVLESFSLKNKFSGGIWKYCVKTKSIGSGKVSVLSITPSQYTNEPIREGDIISAESVAKDRRGYWNLIRYHHIY